MSSCETPFSAAAPPLKMSAGRRVTMHGFFQGATQDEDGTQHQLQQTMDVTTTKNVTVTEAHMLDIKTKSITPQVRIIEETKAARI